MMVNFLDANESAKLRSAINVLVAGTEFEDSTGVLSAGLRSMGNAALNGDYQAWANAAHLISSWMLQAAARADEKAAEVYMGESI
jgi:hypothetical protein